MDRIKISSMVIQCNYLLWQLFLNDYGLITRKFRSTMKSYLKIQIIEKSLFFFENLVI